MSGARADLIDSGARQQHGGERRVADLQRRVVIRGGVDMQWPLSRGEVCQRCVRISHITVPFRARRVRYAPHSRQPER